MSGNNKQEFRMSHAVMRRKSFRKGSLHRHSGNKKKLGDLKKRHDLGGGGWGGGWGVFLVFFFFCGGLGGWGC